MRRRDVTRSGIGRGGAPAHRLPDPTPIRPVSTPSPVGQGERPNETWPARSLPRPANVPGRRSRAPYGRPTRVRGDADHLPYPLPGPS